MLLSADESDLCSEINAPFDEHKIVRSHATAVFPFVTWVMLDGKRLPFAVWKDECDGKNVILRVDAPEIAESKWPFQCRNGYGSP